MLWFWAHCSYFSISTLIFFEQGKHLRQQLSRPVYEEVLLLQDKMLDGCWEAWCRFKFTSRRIWHDIRKTATRDFSTPYQSHPSISRIITSKKCLPYSEILCKSCGISVACFYGHTREEGQGQAHSHTVAGEVSFYMCLTFPCPLPACLLPNSYDEWVDADRIVDVVSSGQRRSAATASPSKVFPLLAQLILSILIATVVAAVKVAATVTAAAATLCMHG